MTIKHVDGESTPGYLTRQDMNILKGIGILMIFLHNYFHWLPGLGLENEFIFRRSNVIEYLTHAFTGFDDFAIYSFAYLGHFGVQIFVFASGYGLYATVQKQDRVTFGMDYFVPRLGKIFCLLLVGTLALYVIQYLNTGAFYDLSIGIEILFFRFSSIWNFSFDTLFKYSGPFWFFGLIVQLYLIFPLLVKIIRESTTAFDAKALITLIAVNIVLYPLLTSFKIPLMGIFVGQMPVFLMGILLAKHGYQHRPAVLVLAILLFLLGQYFWVLHTVASVSITCIMISGYFALRKCSIALPALLSRAAQGLGRISMTIFILNGPLRTLAIFRDEADELIPDRIFVFTLVLILASIPMAWVYKGLVEVFSRTYAGLAGSKP